MSNLKQIGLGMMMYAQDYDERMPQWTYSRPRPWPDEYANTGSTSQFLWYFALLPYVKSWQLYNCPSGATAQNFTGVYNSSLGYGFNYQASSGLCASNCGKSISGLTLAAIEKPAETLGVVDSFRQVVQARMPSGEKWPSLVQLQTGNTCDTTRYDVNCVAVRHFDTVNALFLDGHVKSMQWQNLLSPAGLHYWTTSESPVPAP